MSHHSDDADTMLSASSDSFWEPGNYKRTTKRIEDGNRLCNELVQMVQERADVEKQYAKSLQNWSRKWNDLIEKGPEYGTSEAAAKGITEEAERRANLHSQVKVNLTNDVIMKIKQWQKDTYHKSMMNLKEKKEKEDEFKKVQKPWAKLLDRVMKAKHDYHNACKAERSARNHERNAGGDTSLSADMPTGSVKKLQDRVRKSQEEVEKTKESYNKALQDINAYNAKYMEDMTVVFDRCQDMERARLEFFKETLFGIHKCLNISKDPSLPQIYEELYHTIANSDHDKDLRWWSNNYGVNMAMNWPQFEEPSEKKSNRMSKFGIGTSSNKPPSQKYSQANSEKTGNRNSGVSNGTQGDGNPYDEEEWDGYGGELVDTGEPGVSVRALYDYEGLESDELSFKAGDLFEKLEDEDEQGWCKGRKDGQVGLYPANYVEMAA